MGYSVDSFVGVTYPSFSTPCESVSKKVSVTWYFNFLKGRGSKRDTFSPKLGVYRGIGFKGIPIRELSGYVPHFS